MERLQKVLPPLTAAMPARELKVYISEGLYRELHVELEKCGCGLSGFCRMAIATEIVRRRGEAMRAATTVGGGGL